MKIHVLDMGKTKYGDCLVITNGDRKILIDGGHPGDGASIRFQLSKILGQQPPFAFDLLVVTHCHSDHIGCLPELVRMGDVTAASALVADEYTGFGISREGDGMQAIRGASDAVKSLFVASQEEDYSALPDAEIAQFLFDAGRLVDKYIEMLETLQAAGTVLQRYPGENWDWVQPFEGAYHDFGLQVLGPTSEHLAICAEAIARAARDAVSVQGQDAAAGVPFPELVKRYKSLVQANADAGPAADQPGVGAAKNNQSIVLSVNSGGLTALLAGDMQFAKAEVGGLGPFMNSLFKDVTAASAYDVIKLTHHTSYNAVNERILDEWLKTTHYFVHTGGRLDPGHPEPSVLQLLKDRKADLQLARTDRNGLITFSKEGDEVKVAIDKGRLNDFTENRVSDEAEAPALAVVTPAQSFVPQAVVPQPAPAVSATSDGLVKVTAEIPHTSTRVTITVDIDPEKKKFESQRVGDPGGMEVTAPACPIFYSLPHRGSLPHVSEKRQRTASLPLSQPFRIRCWWMLGKEDRSKPLRPLRCRTCNRVPIRESSLLVATR